MRNFQELAFYGREGILRGTLCDFSRKDFTKNTYSGSCPKGHPCKPGAQSAFLLVVSLADFHFHIS